MANLKRSSGWILGCVVMAGIVIGGINLAVLPVSARETDIKSGERSFTGDVGSVKLTGVSLDVYKYLKNEVKKTAEGSKTSAAYDISSLLHTEKDVQEICNNLATIYDYLLMDCPYDLYWYDKSAENANPDVEGAVEFTYNYTSERKVDAVIRMLVSMEYRSDSLAGKGKSWYYTIDTGRISAAREIPEKAQKIVDANKGKSDYEKLVAYKNAVCDRVVYDEAAVAPDYQGSNGPWQLISVFDDNPNTNVVCEGYTKAFQYLCDLSEFDNARCYTISGEMASEAGVDDHLWNIVTIDGRNYMVDVTNCDENTAGAPDLLFLAVPAGGSWDTQYNFSVGLNYKYDDEMSGLFGEDILRLTDQVYNPPAVPDQPGAAGSPGISSQPDSSEMANITDHSDSSEETDTSADKTEPEKTKESEKSDTSKRDEDSEKRTFEVESLDSSDQGEYKAVEESIRAMYVLSGDELEFVNASKIEELVRGKLTRKHGISASNVQVYEISLKARNEKGEWEIVSAENFPKDGIRITMPYPKGTGKKRYQYYGQHLFAEDVNGYKAGSTEDLEIVKEDGGITFVVHGLSPVAIGWSKEDVDESAEAVLSDGADQQSGTGSSPQKTDVKSPKTSDGSIVLLYEVLMLLALGTIIGGEMWLIRKRKTRKKGD